MSHQITKNVSNNIKYKTKNYKGQTYEEVLDQVMNFVKDGKFYINTIEFKEEKIGLFKALIYYQKAN